MFLKLLVLVSSSAIKATKFISGTLLSYSRLHTITIIILNTIYYQRNLALKCLKRLAKRVKAGTGRRKLIKYSNASIKNKVSKGKSRAINILSVARRRMFLKRWYNYSNSAGERKGHREKVIMMLLLYK